MQKHFVRTIFWVAPRIFIWQPDYYFSYLNLRFKLVNSADCLNEPSKTLKKETFNISLSKLA